MTRSELRERRRLCRALGLFLREVRGISTARLRRAVLILGRTVDDCYGDPLCRRIGCATCDDEFNRYARGVPTARLRSLVLEVLR